MCNNIERIKELRKFTVYHLRPAQGHSFYDDNDFFMVKHYLQHSPLEKNSEKQIYLSTIFLTEKEAQRH